MDTIMTKDQLLDRLHYTAGILASLVLADKLEDAKKWAAEVSDLNYRLNQVHPS